MKKALPIQYIAAFGVPLLMIGLMVVIAKSSVFESNPQMLSMGIIADLLFTVPVVYLFLIRKTPIPRITAVPFLMVGIIVGSIIIPTQNQYYLDLFKTWILPVVELSILSYIIYRVSGAIRQYKINKKESADFFTTLKTTCRQLLPGPVVMPLVTEVAVFYYGFICWGKRKLKENEFTYHRESGSVILLVSILFILAVETVVLHILLSKWNITAAWILTVVSAYSGIQLFGFLKSIFHRPITIENGQLFLRNGIMNETVIDMARIESVELSSKEIEPDKVTRKLSFLGSLESHNVVVRLKEDNILTGLYGMKRKYRNLVFHVDDRFEFIEQIYIANSSSNSNV